MADHMETATEFFRRWPELEEGSERLASLDRAVIANIHLVIVSDAYEARHQMDNNQGHDYHHVQWLVTHAYPPKIIGGTLGDERQLWPHTSHFLFLWLWQKAS